MPFLKRVFILLFLSFIISDLLYSQNIKPNILVKKYPPTALREDAGIMKDIILKMHPVVGIYRSRSFCEELFDKFSLSLKDSLTEKQFRIRLKMILDELRCGHTEALPSKEYIKQSNKEKIGFSPYFFLPLNNKLYLWASVNRKRDTLIKRSAEIKKINGVSVDTMFTVCKKIISADGFIESGKNHYLQMGFNSYYPVLFGRPDTFRVDFMKADKLKSVKYPLIKVKNIPSLILSPKEDSAFVKHKKAALKYMFIDSAKKSMHLKIHAFSRKRFKSAYRTVFRKMKNNKSENLIVDLRFNGGGSLENSYRLLSYLIDTPKTQTLKTAIKTYPDKKHMKGNIYFKLMRFGFGMIASKKTINDTDNFIYTIKPRKKNHFNGKIYVLINGGSFSASCLVSAYLKSNKKTIFIGEETSGAIEGCNAGITPYYKMPNTNIRIRIPAFRVVHDVSPQITGRGIVPDYKIVYEVEDVLTRKDLELNMVKKLIGISK